MVLDRVLNVRLDPDGHDIHISDPSWRAPPSTRAVRTIRPTGMGGRSRSRRRSPGVAHPLTAAVGCVRSASLSVTASG